jgi:transposase-like protein
MQVSRAAELLDAELEVWRNRPLGETPYLILDARYEKVCHGGSVVDCAVLIAIGVTSDGRRSILGTSVSLSEAEVHWRSFLASLIERGLHGVRLITSDDHAGLGQARRACFPSVPWQRCQFHLIQNALHYVPKLPMRRTRVATLFPNEASLLRLVTPSSKKPAKAGKPEKSTSTWKPTNPPQSGSRRVYRKTVAQSTNPICHQVWAICSR